jgi:hypothetical protein
MIEKLNLRWGGTASRKVWPTAEKALPRVVDALAENLDQKIKIINRELKKYG